MSIADELDTIRYDLIDATDTIKAMMATEADRMRDEWDQRTWTALESLDRQIHKIYNTRRRLAGE